MPLSIDCGFSRDFCSSEGGVIALVAAGNADARCAD
jgi:hypothetical protein